MPIDLLDLRLYRLTLLLGFLAGVVVMFSLVSRPDPLTSEVATDGFDGTEAAGLAKEIIRIAPDRTPGSEDNGRAADFVSEQFSEIEGSVVNERRFTGTFDGEDVLLRNVVAVLPGSTSARIVIAAPRDCDGGVCGASSASSTAALIELGRALGTASHQKTIELVSLDGSTAGAAGAKQLASELATNPARAVIVLYQPGAANRRGAALIPWSEGPQSTAVQLTESAARAVDVEGEVPGDAPSGTFSTLLRLAVPAGTGDQAPLVEAGADAVALASAGDLPLPESADGAGAISAETLGSVGRSALGLSFALDDSVEPLDHGPGSYVPLAGKLIPGWSLALLALVLLLPIGIIGAEGTVRAHRRGAAAGPAALWVLSRAACFLAPVVVAYLLALVSIVPEPGWPFNPADYGIGFGEVLVLALLAAVLAGALLAARRLPLPADADEAIAPVTVAGLFLGGLGLWLANPFLALVCVPAIHLWLVTALPEMRGRPAAIAIAACGCLFPLLAVLALGDRLDSGLALPWQLILMFTGGHFAAFATIPACVLAGCLTASLMVATSRPVPPRVERAKARTRSAGRRERGVPRVTRQREGARHGSGGSLL